MSRAAHLASRIVAAVAVLLALLDAGCLGDDPVAAGGSGSGVDAGGLDAALAPDATPPAFCPLGCLPPAPPGWTGPSAVYDGEDAKRPAGCPKDYTLPEISGHDVITVPDAVCTCGAPTYTNDFCDVSVKEYSTTSCSGVSTPVHYSAPTIQCAPLYGGTTAIIVNVAWGGGSCTLAPGSTELPAPTFGRATVSCGLPQVGACPNRGDCVASPLPETPYARLCIHADGDVACPSHDYATKIVSYAKTKEERTCADCSSAGTMALTCGTTFAFPTACAQGVPTGSGAQLPANTSGCFPVPYPILDIVAMAPKSKSCAPNVAAKPGGTVKLDAPVTFCCNR